MPELASGIWSESAIGGGGPLSEVPLHFCAIIFKIVQFFLGTYIITLDKIVTCVN